MRYLIAIMLSALPAFGAYGYQASVTFPGATTSTQTNITQVFSFSDTRLKTVANGGQIQNLCTRNTRPVPCDFVLTNDSTCGSVTGSYSWGWDGDYSATTGTGHVWVKIPSYTTSSLAVTVCFGNASISTYQGGSTGAEFDSGTTSAYHLANVSGTLFATDYSSSANNGTIFSATTATGQIDGSASFSGTNSSYLSMSSGFPYLTFTYEAWVYSGGVTGAVVGELNQAGNPEWRIDSANTMSLNSAGQAGICTSSTTVTTNTWTYVAVSYDGTTCKQYQGTSGAGTTTFSEAFSNGPSSYVGSAFTVDNFSGRIDELRISNSIRSASWLATNAANEASPPVMSSSSPVATIPFLPAIY